MSLPEEWTRRPAEHEPTLLLVWTVQTVAPNEPAHALVHAIADRIDWVPVIGVLLMGMGWIARRILRPQRRARVK